MHHLMLMVSSVASVASVASGVRRHSVWRLLGP
jgi:hypothetical protein